MNDAGRSDPKGVLVGQDQTDAQYDPEGRLEYGQTYYWRVDEVNAAPDSTIFKGMTWSFTVEPLWLSDHECDGHGLLRPSRTWALRIRPTVPASTT